MPETSLASLLAEHRAWESRFAAKLVDHEPFLNSLDPHKKLRIGFISSDLGEHPVGYFTARLFQSLDTTQFETFVYSDRLGQDSLSAKIQCHVDRWNDTAAIGDEGLYRRIRNDGIDILFDLAGHTAQNRLLVFARRAAPLQISWAGYVGTTGLSTMNYVLADRYHAPIESEAFYSESVLRMPHGYVTYQAPLNAPDVAPLPALLSGRVTFGAMCNPAKVNPELLKLWARVLQSIPGSRLLLCYSGWQDQGNRQRVEEAFAQHGCVNCVDFDQKSGAAICMEMYNQIDIALDTRPYSGGLTTCEAMWMGVPTITWPDERFAGRHSLSHLMNVGLTDWVVNDADSYVELAVRRSNDLKGLAKLRAELRSRVASSPLCNGQQFADDFAKMLRQVWSKYCTSSMESADG